MSQYVGLDVSVKEVSICVVNTEGAVLARGTVQTDQDQIACLSSSTRQSASCMRAASWPFG